LHGQDNYTINSIDLGVSIFPSNFNSSHSKWLADAKHINYFFLVPTFYVNTIDLRHNTLSLPRFTW